MRNSSHFFVQFAHLTKTLKYVIMGGAPTDVARRNSIITQPRKKIN
jgi:hypothetical protein